MMDWFWEMLGLRGFIEGILDRMKVDLVKGYCTTLSRDQFYLIMLPGDFTARDADQVRRHLEDNGVDCLVAAGVGQLRLVELGK